MPSGPNNYIYFNISTHRRKVKNPIVPGDFGLLFSHAAENDKNLAQDVRWTSALRRPKHGVDRKLACREVLSFFSLGRLARIEDSAAIAAGSSVSCVNPRCMAEQ